MHLPHQRAIAVAATAAAAVATTALLAPASPAAPAPTAWTRISGPSQPGSQLGLARTADGVLHVAWNRGTSPTTILETRISPAGKTGGTATIASGFDGNGGLALLTMPDNSLRLFAAGATHPGSAAYGINTFTAPAAGGTWTLQPGAYWGGAEANAASVIGAALAHDGQPVTAWRGDAAEGVPPGAIPASPFQVGMTESQLATDAAGGGTVLSGVTNAGAGGVYVQQVLPSMGPRVVLPLPFGENDWNTSLSGRLGAPGVYTAYADAKAARLYRYGGGTTTLAHGPFTSASVCAAPGGRLWVAWGDKSDGLFVTRSNRAVNGFEPVQHLRLVQSTSDGLTFVQCEGSAGPADLFADVLVGAAPGFWQTHVLPRFALQVHVTGRTAVLTARDAGDPLPGATIAVGSRHVTTNAQGQARLTLRSGAYSARASAATYAPASASFSLR